MLPCMRIVAANLPELHGPPCAGPAQSSAEYRSSHVYTAAIPRNYRCARNTWCVSRRHPCAGNFTTGLPNGSVVSHRHLPTTLEPKRGSLRSKNVRKFNLWVQALNGRATRLRCACRRSSGNVTIPYGWLSILVYHQRDTHATTIAGSLLALQWKRSQKL